MRQKYISLCIFASALAMMTASAGDSLYVSHVHRGGGKYERPDNTLETFKWCWENGSALECDCRKTRMILFIPLLRQYSMSQ